MFGFRKRNLREWHDAMNELAIAYGDRFTEHRSYQDTHTDLPNASVSRYVASADRPPPWTSLRALAHKDPDTPRPTAVWDSSTSL
jgi:hypothetical protein